METSLNTICYCGVGQAVDVGPLATWLPLVMQINTSSSQESDPGSLWIDGLLRPSGFKNKNTLMTWSNNIWVLPKNDDKSSLWNDWQNGKESRAISKGYTTLHGFTEPRKQCQLGSDESAHGKEFLLQADAHTPTHEGSEHTSGRGSDADSSLCSKKTVCGSQGKQSRSRKRLFK